MVVIDIGSAEYSKYPEDLSVMPLIERFKPHVYYGFDPCEPATMESTVGDTRVVCFRKAAWIRNGMVGFSKDPHFQLRSRVCEECGPEQVEAIDIAEFIINLGDGRIVMKIDAEGSEFTILPYLHETGTDALLELLLVEWHGEPLPIEFRCPVEPW